MENMQNCRVVDFGTVIPGKVHTKRIKISSGFLVKNIESSKLSQPLEEAFTVKRDMNFDPERDNRFVVQYFPSLPHRKSYAYMLIRFEDGSSQPMYIKGATTGSDIEFSVTKIHFKTNTKIPISHFKLTMENFSHCNDYFCWDFAPEDSEVNIVPHSGVIGGQSRLELSITFIPKKIGLFYRALPCLFKYQEPLYVDIFGFHSNKELKLDLDKYIHLNKPMTTYPTNYCRYMSDVTTRLPIQNELPVTASARYIDFGRVPVNSMGKRGHSVEHLTLTNNDEKDLVVVWNNPKGSPFRIDPSKLVLRSFGGSSQFLITFSPAKPQIFYSAEIHASLLWGLRLEYKAPFCVTVHLIGDSFTTNSCGWGPSYTIERTRIVLPGTVPNIPTYTAFQISKTGPLPIQFKLEPIDKTNVFVVKPREGIIKDDFGLIVIQLLPQDQVDVLFKEEWMLTLNKFAQVKLEICGSCELPFLLAGEDKNVIFPPTTLGAYSYLQVPIKNPTRLELEYRCQPCSTDRVLVPHDSRRIGPGETQLLEFGFRPLSLGTSTFSQGIWMRWAPYHSAAMKALRGKDINSETILCLTGTAEKVRIHATPDSLKMTSVFLHDTATGSFILSNDGNTTAHIRLNCEETSVFSRIGEWAIVPNDVNLGPGQTIELKIRVKGEQIGITIFEIQYATYESHLFRKATSEWTKLACAEVFVFVFSLRVIDLRFEGLAKSLSKHVLWSLLRINRWELQWASRPLDLYRNDYLNTQLIYKLLKKYTREHNYVDFTNAVIIETTDELPFGVTFYKVSLNEILNVLETKPEHLSSMKIPEYHVGTPPLKIELLVKNTCPIPLWLHVDVKKSCQCLPQKNDTISWRITDFSCPHDDQLTAKFDRRKVLAGETVVLTMLVQYDETEECDFTMSLSVSRKPNKKANRATDKSINRVTDKLVDPVVVRINTERQIIIGAIASLNFLLPKHRGPRSFKFSMEDVFIGDNSRYVQVIWMYNHSQKDNRYWAEWLFVNNRVFRILNTRARVAAYSTYPLFIEFIPFEMKTYKAKLAVVDEVGEEFHISIEARGSVCQDLNPIRMLKKMPLDSHFVDQGTDIELSQSHIVLSPMPTHSFDKHLFFMKNKSKETICFSWQCLIVWSTIKVLVQPKEGELQPGEIFPIQMHIHTYRTAAMLNFLVECIYFSKTNSTEYWKKCRVLENVTKTFDSCFVFKPDKEIEIAYHNPTNKLRAGDPPMNKIVSIGGSICIFNREHMDVTTPCSPQQLKFIPPPRIDLATRAKDMIMSKNHFYDVTEVLRVTLRNIVTSRMFKECIMRKRPALRYLDFPDHRGRPKRRKLPGRQMSMLLATILYSSLMKLFGFEPVVYHDLCIPVVGRFRQENNILRLYNVYYEQMLSTGIDQMCLPPENVRVRRTQSRDQLAFVQRMSI